MKIIIIIGLILLLMTSGVAIASDISDADYIATVRITNNSTANTSVCVPISGANTTNLINLGFLNATANNSLIRSSAGADVPFMPGYNAEWIVYVDTISSDSVVDYTWYNNSTGGKHVYFPDTGGMTSPNITLSDNFTVTLSDVYIIDGDFFGIQDAINATYNATSETVTLTIQEYSLTETLLTTGAGSVTTIPILFGAATHWQAVNTIDDATSYVETGVAAWSYDLYEIQDSSGSGIIDSVEILTRTYENKNRSELYTHTTLYNGTERSPGAAWTNYTETYTTNPNTSAAWTWQEVDDLGSKPSNNRRR